MKQQSSNMREESGLFPEFPSKQERPPEPTEPTFVDDDELLSLEETAFVTRGHLPEDLYRKFRSDMKSLSSSKEDPNVDNR